MTKENKIDDAETVTAYKYGDTLEMSNVVGGDPTFVKYDADHMINRDTGEIIEVDHAVDRSDPRIRQSLKASFKRLKRLIGANFSNLGSKTGLWLTLTYAQPDGQPMTDQDRLYQDFRKFIQKLKRYLKPRELLYIVAMEPQASGSFHAHILMKCLDKKPFYLKNADVAEMWGQGFVNVRRISRADNVSAYLMAYLMAYLTDIDINNPDDDIKKQDGEKPKGIIKGSRINFTHRTSIYTDVRKTVNSQLKLRLQGKQLKRSLGLKVRSLHMPENLK